MTDFPIHFSGQLREHLRALRKTRGLTQAALGERVGVGQARIAEIESNPGAVSVDQIMVILSALQSDLVLRPAQLPEPAPPAYEAPAAASPAPRRKGSW